MSSGPTVEDYFDDETDLPLPSSSQIRTLPDQGYRGALLEEIADEDDDLDFTRLAEQSRGVFGEGTQAPITSTRASTSTEKGKVAYRDGADSISRSSGGPPINPNTPMGTFMGDMMRLQQVEDERIAKLRSQFEGANMVDASVYKSWHTVYPLYFDAKVSINNGRRVGRKDSLWWPQATHISAACRTLGLPSVLEPDKTHPADWANPGRVKVQIVEEGRFVNPIVKNRAQLYHQLSKQILASHPSLVFTSEARPNKSTKVITKDKKKKSKATPSTNPFRLPSRPPRAPQPVPTLEERLPLHSPMVPTGVAVAAVKREVEAEKENKKKGLTMGGEEKQPKMKRVVVRGKR
ncbi:hypothetical protein TREMEDRAFT_67581 [Tremella mesenterica DSM 1558]|uniref:uncharacterized protein n=1 Tax=Tremella mesenterica (strain ATCC 24925 / CBS 8224 / DSM 1558 / NBRC 9311 / NRRL Y-6157 / RJB 2259-6 / UBC 559-6) TaxID=578456 RepID=UPI0003F49454|nr:uncharacterized protein TREMEDRAFT_67581 [Tremella mesenterica DSM 1558]EIW71120.1 hypothetical protein TREMEDRAFT_67581 [Tremella mesenterica DSM 1558]